MSNEEMSDENDRSVFVEYFGDSPYIRVLDFLIEGQDFDYSMTEVVRGAGVGWSVFVKIWKQLLGKEVIVSTREIGNAKLFKLNRGNGFVKRLIKLDKDLSKLAGEEIVVK